MLTMDTELHVQVFLNDSFFDIVEEVHTFRLNLSSDEFPVVAGHLQASSFVSLDSEASEWCNSSIFHPNRPKKRSSIYTPDFSNVNKRCRPSTPNDGYGSFTTASNNTAVSNFDSGNHISGFQKIGSTEKVFTCDLCGKQSNSKSYLSRHVNLIHKSTTVAMNCEMCSFSTKWSESLKKHYKNVHKIPDSFSYHSSKTDAKQYFPGNYF